MAGAVIKALDGCEHLEVSAKTMLLEGLPHAMGTAKSTAHAFQLEFVGLIEEALNEGRKRRAEELATSQSSVEEAEGELQNLQTTEKELGEVAEASAAATKTAEEAVANAAQAVKVAEAEHEKEQRAIQAFAKVWEERQQNHAKASAVIEGSLRMLVDGGWDDEEVKTMAVEAVVELLGEVNTDKAIIAAAPHALGLKPDDRKAFDTVVVDAVQAKLNAHVSGLDSQIKEAAPEETRKKAEVLGVWAIADCARDDAKTTSAGLKSAKDAQQTADINLEWQRELVSKQQKAIAGRSTKRARIETQLQEVDDALTAISKAGEEEAEPQPSGADAAVEGAATSTQA